MTVSAPTISASRASVSTASAAAASAPTRAARRGRPGYDRRGVLEIAVSAFNDHGYEATSMEMLAARLGLSKSAIYHHFSSKTEMLQAALDEALAELEASIDELPANESAIIRLESLVRASLHVLTQKLPYVTLLLRLRGNTDMERAAQDRRRALDRRVIELVAQAQQEGSIRSDIDPHVATLLVFGMINSITEWYRPGGRSTVDSLADNVAALALDGLRARPIE